jgi:Bacterial dnaA protein helix-turn-helix
MELTLSLPEKQFARKPLLLTIFLEVCARHRLRPIAIRAPDRSTHIVMARNEFFYRAAAETDHSIAYIGRFLGRNHTTVIHSSTHHAFDNDLPLPRGGYPSRTSRILKIRRHQGRPTEN